MEEKIKVNVTKNIYDILLKDAEAFEFYKEDEKTLNKNSFITTLIINYYLAYQDKEQSIISEIQNTLSEMTDLKDSIIKDASNNIVNKINKNAITPNNEKFDKVIAIKPTKESKKVLNYIETYLLDGKALSEYFRNLFYSYSLLTQDNREKIIFKENFQLLNKAIKENKKIFFVTNTRKEEKHESSPFKVVSSKEEMHLYLLTKHKGICKTFRISRMKEITILNENTSFNEKDVELFNKMIEYGPQFFFLNDEEEVRIRLTRHGEDLYKLIYLNRPVVSKIDGCIYYFNCSYLQIMTYFSSFGKDAFIISPMSLRNRIEKYYKDAYFSYKNGI